MKRFYLPERRDFKHYASKARFQNMGYPMSAYSVHSDDGAFKSVAKELIEAVGNGCHGRRQSR